jgi:RNA polymerase-binding transcription factor DksA
MKSMTQEYISVREDLQARRTRLLRRLERITQDVRRARKPLEADWEEQAVERENDEVLDALSVATCAELQRTEATLNRLDQGQYGVCEDCGRKIPFERLEALPDASLCLPCAIKPGTRPKRRWR